MISDPTAAHLVHYVLEWAALATGFLIYHAKRRRRGLANITSPGMFAVMVCGLLGAAMGNKISFGIQVPEIGLAMLSNFRAWTAGQSIVGGLLGGWIGVEIGKRISGISQRTGDDFVPAILVGLVIGRVGCFLAGLHDGTYGLPTQLPWGVDFGDGIGRHPTQLYECLAALIVLCAYPRWSGLLSQTPGLSFRMLMLSYLVWRLAIDTIKPVPYAYAFGLSGIQWVCIVGTIVITLGLVRDHRRSNHV